VSELIKGGVPVGYTYDYELPLSGQDFTLLWLLMAVLIGELATWAAPRGTDPRTQVLVATGVSTVLVLMPLLALASAFFA